MSDEFISDRQTFCVILDRNKITAKVSHFRPSEFCTVEGPDATRAMRADTPGAHRDPRVLPGTLRVPVEIFVSSLGDISISSVN